MLTRRRCRILAVIASALLAPGMARAQAPLVGAVHGVVIAGLPASFGGADIPVPGAVITLQTGTATTATTAPVARVTANADGSFATPMQPAGSYRVCGTAVGFAETCAAKPVVITKDTVFLIPSLALKPLGSVLQGQVTLRSGEPAARIEAGAGTSAAAAQIVLKDAAGHVVAGPVGANGGGRYVLSPVSPAANLTLTATYEGSSVARAVTLTAADIASGKAVDLVLPVSAPVVTSVSMTADGQRVAAAVPGTTVIVTVAVQDAGPGPLHYRWTTNSTGLSASDSPSVTWALPKAPVANVLFGEVTNGQGGVARFSLTVPLADSAPATADHVLDFRSNGIEYKKIGNIGDITGKIPPICIPCIYNQIYTPPAHQGNFIDPILMMNGACANETACESEAKAYYQTIGALDAGGNPTATLGTFKAWKNNFGFGADPSSPASGEVRAVYYNNADLQFGRDMHCKESSGTFSTTIACYVSNFGDGTKTFGSDPQTAIGNAIANTGRIASVAMVYSASRISARGHPPAPPQVQFFVFNGNINGDVNDGSLLNAALLDSQGLKAVPGVCVSCHGGNYVGGTTHNVQTSNFLPFDAPSFIFTKTQNGFLGSAQRTAIRSMNAMVEVASSRATIPQLIDGWYKWCGGVGKAGCYVDDAGHPFYPTQACPTGDQSGQSCGWPTTTWGGVQAQSFYQHVPRVYCRTCHVAQSNFLNVDSFADWKAQAGLIQQYLLGSQASPPIQNFMPFAEVPYNGFWLDFDAQGAAATFLNASGP